MDSRQQYTVIHSVIDAMSNLRQGDYLFLDLDDTLILTGIAKYQSAVHLIEKCIPQQLDLLRASGISVIGLTARNVSFSSTTDAQLKSVNIFLDTILYASTNYLSSNEYLKGKVVKQYIANLSSKKMNPKRIIVIDNSVEQLNSISEQLSKQKIPYVLHQYVREIHYSVNSHKVKIDFPDDLESFTEIESLGGGTKSTFLIRRPGTQQKFVVKFGADSEAIALEMLCNAIYHVLEVPVPNMHVYYRLSKRLAKQLGRTNCHAVFQVSEYIESNVNNNEVTTLKSARQHFVSHAFLGNIDVAKYANFVGQTLIDAGANFMRRAKGEARTDDASWLIELSSLRNANINPTAHLWFSSLTINELHVQANRIVDKSHEIERVILSLSKKLNLSNQLRDTFLQLIADRIDVLVSKYSIANYPIARIDKKVHPNYTAAGVLTYQLINGVPHILLAKRAKHEWWDNFGGRSEMGDQSLAMTAAREVMEESCGQLRYDPIVLDSNPSHDMVSDNDSGVPFTYRLYIMPASYIDLTKFNDHEHTDYRLVPLSVILEALNKTSNRVICEAKYTVSIFLDSKTHAGNVESILLYPPLFKILRQSSVYDNLNRLLLNKKMVMQHTQGSILNSFIQKPTAIRRPIETVKQKKNHTMIATLNHVSVLQEMKRMRLSVTVCDEMSAMSQSELYLKMLLKGDYKDNQLHENILFYIDNMFCAGRVISLHEKSRLVSVCTQLIQNEKRTGNDYIYFYHSCNDLVAFAYSVYTMLYEKLQLSAHWPVFRGNKLTGEPSVYSNVFLFGNHDRPSSSSLFYFLHNITHEFFEQDEMRNDLKLLLSDFLKPLQIPISTIDRLLSFYRLHEKQWGGALYQIRLPSSRVGAQVVVCDYEGNLKQLNNNANLVDILTMMKRQPSMVVTPDVTNYMLYLQARITLTPENQVAVQPVYWNLEENEKTSKQVYDHHLNEIIKDIARYALPNIVQGNCSLRYSELPLSRLLLERYHALGVLEKESGIVQQLLKAILHRKSDDIVRILTDFPGMRDQVYVPQGSVGSFRRFASMTVIEMIVNSYKGYSLDWLSTCYGNLWWISYPVKSIDDLKLIITFMLPRYDEIILLLIQFKNIIQHASVVDLLYFARLFEVGTASNDYALFSIVFSHDNRLTLCFHAVEHRMSELTERLIPCLSDAELNCVDAQGRTLLYVAVQRCSLSIVSQLITMSNGILNPNISCSSDNDATPFHMAVSNGDKHIITELLHIPSLDPNKPNRYSETPLVFAAKRDLNLMRWLLATPHVEFNQSSLFDALCEIASEPNYRDADEKQLIAAHHYILSKHVYLSEEVYSFVLQYTCEAVRLILLRLKSEFLSEPTMFIWYRSTVHFIDILAVLNDSECLKIATWNDVLNTENDVVMLLRRIEAYPVQCEALANRYRALSQPKQLHFS